MQLDGALSKIIALIVVPVVGREDHLRFDIINQLVARMTNPPVFVIERLNLKKLTRRPGATEFAANSAKEATMMKKTVLVSLANIYIWQYGKAVLRRIVLNDPIVVDLIAKFARLSTINRTRSEVEYRSINGIVEEVEIDDGIDIDQISAVYKLLQAVEHPEFTSFQVPETEYA